jgi:DNA invertase Pin-like site-specific DNA recombinase
MMRKPFTKKRTIVTEDLARKIQEARDSGMKALDIMRKFDVAEQTVYKCTKRSRLDQSHA